MKQKMLIWATLVFIGASVCTSVYGQKTTGRMNIIYIMSDDHAYQAISAYVSV